LLALGLVVAVACGTAHGQSSETDAAIVGQATYQFLQRLDFLMPWSGILHGGTATIHVEGSGAEKHVAATADSAGVVNMLYTVRDRFQSAVDPKTFAP